MGYFFYIYHVETFVCLGYIYIASNNTSVKNASFQGSLFESMSGIGITDVLIHIIYFQGFR